MGRLCLFFDVDGTLLPFGEGLPNDTLHALRKARENGHYVFLSTGRSPEELDPRLSAFTFDGGVYCGGALALFQGERVFTDIFTKEEVTLLYEEADKGGWQVLIQTSSHGSFMGKIAKEKYFSYFKVFHGGKVLNLGKLTESEERICSDVTKLNILSEKRDMEDVKRHLSGRYDFVDNTIGFPFDMACEIVPKGVSKARAMKRLLSAIGMGIKDSIAFGDGANDVDIIREAGVGVAMGNAIDVIKKEADYVTDDCDKGGIKNALEKLGVI